MKTNLPEKSIEISPTLQQIKEAITEHYRDKLAYLVLYGSYARGDFNAKSDIDLLVVLNDMQSEMKEIETLAEIKTDILLDSEIYISTNPVSAETIEKSDFLFYKNIRNEGIRL